MTNLHRALPILVACALPAFSKPVINELMYRPGSTYPENTALEFIEIHNPDETAVDLSGWAITDGIQFVFPSATVIAPHGYLVVAANPAALGTATGYAGALGPWQAGTNLSNSGEEVTLEMPDGEGGWTPVDVVNYADEGDWALSSRNTLGGWSWICQASGGGCSAERRNPMLDADSGQNWASSAVVGGSPGAANSCLTTNVAPVVSKVQHSPAVPKSTDVVTISCHLTDESAVGSISATLYWRDASGLAPGPFQSVAMTNDGNGRFATTLGAKTNKTIVEFYIQATDGVLSRTWPAPTSEGQNANCTYQVDDEPGSSIGAATYRLVLTAAENAAYENLAATNPQSDREFNVTFVADHGEETTIRYRTRMRIRGQSSRNFIYKPLRISFPTDDRWEGLSEFSLNPKYPWVQFLGMRAIQAAGLVAGDAVPVELRRNGVESVSGSGTNPDYGMWVRIEAINGDYADRHYPEAVGVQLYRKNAGTTQWSSNFTSPSHPDGTYSGWSKQNQSGSNDWSDVVNFSTVWQTVAGPHFPDAPAGDVKVGNWDGTPFSDQEVATLSTVANLDQMARWLAVMTILNNTEHNISNGSDNDYGGAFVNDGTNRRLNLIPHDTDNMLGKGDSPKGATAVSLFAATETDDIFKPLLPLLGDSTRPGNAAFRLKYLTTIRELYGSLFDSDTNGNANPPFHVWIDNHLGNWVPAATRTQLKTYMTVRQNYLLGLIGAPKIAPTAATSDGTFTQAPAGALRINEVLAENVSAHVVSGSYPDIIELHNTGTTDIPISGFKIADSSNEYTFPVGSGKIVAGGFRIIHSNTLDFGLSSNGDMVRLIDDEGVTLDEITFGKQVPNLSISRVADGSWALTSPSINGANNAALTLGNVSGVRLNEWAGNTNYRLGDDFFELYNPSAAPVSLAGVCFTDNLASYPSRYRFPPLSFLGAGALLEVDSDTFGFGLNGHFETVWLTGSNGSVIDHADFIAQHADTSTGRSPDGGTTWATFAVPSPGISNSTTSTGYEDILEGLRITEIMYAPVGGDNFEFIELQNIGSTPLNLGGVRFTSGIDYVFVAGTTLGAKDFIVICKARTSFLNRYPGLGSKLATGVYTGTLSNTGETLELALPSPWNLNVLKFKYSSNWYSSTAGPGRSLNTVDQGVTHPSRWGESPEWMASSMQHGSPGSGEAPVITSVQSSGGIIGDSFSYLITATRSPYLFGATGLPGGLAIDTASGLISGAPTESGVFPVNITATSASSSTLASATLSLAITAHGDFHHFAWAPLGIAFTGVPFQAEISARDSGGRLIPEFNGTLTLSAATASGDVVFSPGQGATAPPAVKLVSPILITELTDETEDQFELQNVTASTIDTSGWFVVVGDSTSNINLRNATTYNLPASLGGQSLLRVSDTTGTGRVPFGADIKWSHTNSKGWIMLFDASSTLRDFAAFGWTASNLSGLSIAVNGKTIAPIATGHWSGAGFTAGVRGSAFDTSDSWKRVGSADGHTAADWQWAQYGTSFGVTNIGLVLPWVITTPLHVSPTAPVFTGGIFQGQVVIDDSASNVVLTVKDSAGHSGDSPAFDVLAPNADTDSDGIPDIWEIAHGLSRTIHGDAALDADADGQSNHAEYEAGTDPQLASSVFATHSLSLLEGGQLSVSWSAVAGKTYRVFTSDNLSSWTLRDTVVPAQAGMISRQVAGETTGRTFVKVTVGP